MALQRERATSGGRQTAAELQEMATALQARGGAALGMARCAQVAVQPAPAVAAHSRRRALAPACCVQSELAALKVAAEKAKGLPAEVEAGKRGGGCWACVAWQ